MLSSMSRPLPLIVLLACAACASPAPTAPTATVEHATPAHDRAFWQHLAADNWRVPPNENTLSLALELATHLGDTDPQVRDEIPYAALAHWLFPEPALDAAARNTLARQLESQLNHGIGDRDGEGVLLRSFSALHLSLLTKSDLDHPFLDDAAWRTLFDRALTYLAAERDVRGYVIVTGWHHSVAHTADWLKFLARSPHLTPADQTRLLAALESKLATLDEVLVWGEDERLAQCVVSLVRRDDFDAQAFTDWLARIEARHAQVWKNQPFDPRAFVAARNLGNVLRCLPAALAQRSDGKPHVARAAADVLTTLTRL
jgi:hypothetical protein